MQSPCIKVCVIEPDSGLCAGCSRTLEEIARWSVMSEGERRKIVAELARRKPNGVVMPS